MSDELEFVVDFPTLGDLADAWIEQHCRVPNGFDRGAAFRQSDWQFWCTANHYRVREDVQWVPSRPLLNQAFVYRRSLVVAPQKTGKGPWSAAVTAFEAAGHASSEAGRATATTTNAPRTVVRAAGSTSTCRVNQWVSGTRPH